MTVKLSPKEMRNRRYMSRPFKNREKIEKSMKEILDLIDEKKYQEAMYKAMLFIPKLETTIVSKIKKQVQDSKSSTQTNDKMI